MPEYPIGNNATTDLSGTVQDVQITPANIDPASGIGARVWDYPDAANHLGFLKQIAEMKSALKVLVMRVCGSGWDAGPKTARLKAFVGWGNDTFDTICENILTQSKALGDGFAEIIRDENKDPINLKPLYTGDMKVFSDENGLIEKYEQKSHSPDAKNKEFRRDQIFHISNDRLGNEIHGTSVVASLKVIIEAKNEALSDERKIRHRELAMGVLRVDTGDEVEKKKAKEAYQDAVNKGEVLVLPEGFKLEDNPNTPRDRLQWLQYLDNLLYQVIGTPKVLVTSEGYTEAGGKAGLLAFEPTEIAEKLRFEAAFLAQVGIKFTFTRTPSLLGPTQETEQKNSGQTAIQANETQITASRTE